ncbi:MAG: hypothetical protein RIQ71_1956 [Verrucomicrobiota bacterium]|jgi:subtilisin family serine protease
MKRRTGVMVICVAVLAIMAGLWLYRQLAVSPRKDVSVADGQSSTPAGNMPQPQAAQSPPPAPQASPTVAATARADQPPHLRPGPPARSPEWKLLDWSVKPLPQKPGVLLRAASFRAGGKYPFIRVEQEITFEADGRAKILGTREMVGDQIIVKLRVGATQLGAESLASLIGAKATPRPFAPDTWIFKLGRTLDAVPDGLQKANSSPAPVDYAEPDLLVRPARLPNDPKVTDFTAWHLYNNTQIDKDIRAAKAWDRRASAAYGTTNKVIVAVLDTGVRYSHQDLSANMWRNPGETPGDGIDNDGNGWKDDIYGIDAYGSEDFSDANFNALRDPDTRPGPFSNEETYTDSNGNGVWDVDSDPMDTDGHGTHCAGLIGASGNNGVGSSGVAWAGVEIMALRFINGTGSLSDEILCMDYARRHGAKVISGSFGQDGGQSQAEIDAISRLNSSGVVFVAAAGNGGTDYIGDNNNGSLPFYPASYSNANIIAVGATDRNDNKTGFSNYGATAVDLFAPGDNIYSTRAGSDTSYSSGSGTSFAAPIVAGAVALLVSEYPSDTVSQRVARVISPSAVDVVPALAGLCVTGGRLNLAKLLPAADADTLPQALVWHRPSYTEPLINSAMRTPAVIAISNNITVYSGFKKFNNTNGVNTNGLVNQTGGWLFYRSSPAVSWSSNALGWHTNSGDYQFWKGAISNVPAGTTEYFLQMEFDSGARTTYSFYTNNADGFSTGTNQATAQTSPYAFSISKNAAIVTIGGTKQTYVGTARPVVVGTTPAGLATVVTYNGIASAPTNAGTYSVVASIDDANYEGTAAATLTVAKAAAGIVLGDLSQVYNGVARAVSVATTPPGLLTTVTYNGAASAPTNAGTYTVVASITDTNYQGSATNILTIGRATPVIGEIPVAAAITYGETLASSVLSGGATDVAGSFTFSAPATIPTAGTNSHSVTFTPADTANYESVTTAVDVTVNKAAATVQIENLSQSYNGTPRAVSVATTPQGLAASEMYNGSASPPDAVGTYAVTVVVTDPNYEGSASGTLVVDKGPGSIELSALEQIYDGAPKPVAAVTDPPGLSVGLLYDGSADAPVNAGTYTVVASIDDANYVGSVTNTLAVEKAAAGIAVGDLSQVYNGTARAVLVATTPPDLVTAVTYNGAASAPTNAGTYSFIAVINDANYQGSATNTLTIGRATPVISEIPVAAVITYGQTLGSSALSGGAADVAGSFAFTALATTPAAGTNSQSVTFTPADTANYESVSNAVEVTVNKAAAMVQIGDLSQSYNGAPKPVSVTTEPPGLPVSITYDGSLAPPAAEGNYAVTATVTDPNYEGSSIATLSIIAQVITYESFFGNAAPAGDADGDGVPALVEYALGGSTNSDDVRLLPRMVPGSRMALVAEVRTNNTDHLSVQAQVSTRLADGWFAAPVPGTRAEDQSGVPENFERRIYQFDASTNSRVFMRLLFDLPSQTP